eukprot:jgi/Bigna1/83086/fgenesh1_pg.101_\
MANRLEKAIVRRPENNQQNRRKGRERNGNRRAKHHILGNKEAGETRWAIALKDYKEVMIFKMLMPLFIMHRRGGGEDTPAQISFKKQDRLLIIDTNEDPEWWMARNDHGVGLVPSR